MQRDTELEFVNTIGSRKGQPHEKADHYANLTAWGYRAGILSEPGPGTAAPGRRLLCCGRSCFEAGNGPADANSALCGARAGQLWTRRTWPCSTASSRRLTPIAAGLAMSTWMALARTSRIDTFYGGSALRGGTVISSTWIAPRMHNPTCAGCTWIRAEPFAPLSDMSSCGNTAKATASTAQTPTKSRK